MGSSEYLEMLIMWNLILSLSLDSDLGIITDNLSALIPELESIYGIAIFLNTRIMK